VLNEASVFMLNEASVNPKRVTKCEIWVRSLCWIKLQYLCWTKLQCTSSEWFFWLLYCWYSNQL